MFKSNNAHTIINIKPLSHILDICILIFSSCAIFTVYPNRLMKQHPTFLLVITTRAREGGPKDHRAKQKCLQETQSVTYVAVLSTLSDLSDIDVQPPPSFLCCPRPSSHHPSSPTSVSLVAALNLLPQSSPFWPYGTHPFFPHAQTISIFSDLPLLVNSLSIPALLHTSSFLTLSIRDTTTKLLKHIISRKYTFSQHFSYPMPLLHTTPLVQLLLHRDTRGGRGPQQAS